jgi:hypothetical protein
MIGFPFTSVWGTKMRLTFGIATAAALLAAASPAAAQTTSADGIAKGTVLQPLTLSNGGDLDFGTIVASDTAGSVTIEATLAGKRIVDGGVTEVLSDKGQSGKFSGAGEPGTDVELSLRYDPTLYNAAKDPLNVTRMYLAGGATTQTVRTDATSGAFTTYVGGEFEIAASQKPGVYEGTFEVTAVYP